MDLIKRVFELPEDDDLSTQAINQFIEHFDLLTLQLMQVSEIIENESRTQLSKFHDDGHRVTDIHIVLLNEGFQRLLILQLLL